ncbi:MAG: hypothetical protein Q8L72_05145 [Moraxellaceae bacterium]|nr:hypothetical protein [Moraxellaceae bacterium]
MNTLFLICATMIQSIPNTTNVVATPTAACIYANPEQVISTFDHANAIGAVTVPNAAAGKSQVVSAK